MEEKEIERLIKISKERQLFPETFVPWHEEPKEGDLFLTEKLNSLEGLPIYDTLSDSQKLELGRHEGVQALYSYAWTETLLCLFLSRYMLRLQPDNIKYRFLLREVIEECRHQEMFAQAILQLNGKPIRHNGMHKFLGKFAAKFLSIESFFMTILAVEIIADTYGYLNRKDPKIYSVLRKISELHNIEEGRHIHFTKDLLTMYTSQANYLKRTSYSLSILLQIYFLRTLYVKKEIFDRIGLENTDQVYKIAYKNFKEKFAVYCLPAVVEFVDEWKGFNLLTRWAWQLFLKVEK